MSMRDGSPHLRSGATCHYHHKACCRSNTLKGVLRAGGCVKLRTAKPHTRYLPCFSLAFCDNRIMKFRAHQALAAARWGAIFPDLKATLLLTATDNAHTRIRRFFVAGLIGISSVLPSRLNAVPERLDAGYIVDSEGQNFKAAHLTPSTECKDSSDQNYIMPLLSR